MRTEDTASDKRDWLITDRLGSTINTVDAANTSNVTTHLYYPFGQERGTAAGSGTDRMYTGQVSDDADTGLLFYNARYYDPALRLFTAADTIIPDPANPQTFNRYAYVNNNPILYNDPTGHDACAGCWGSETEPTFDPVVYMIWVLGELDKTEDLTPSITKSELRQLKRVSLNELDMKDDIRAYQGDLSVVQVEDLDVAHDVWGNIAFGVVAKKLGISPQTATTGGWLHGKLTGGHNTFTDQVAIDVGYRLHDQVDGDLSKLTAEMVIAEIIASRAQFESAADKDGRAGVVFRSWKSGGPR